MDRRALSLARGNDAGEVAASSLPPRKQCCSWSLRPTLPPAAARRGHGIGRAPACAATAWRCHAMFWSEPDGDRRLAAPRSRLAEPVRVRRRRPAGAARRGRRRAAEAAGGVHPPRAGHSAASTRPPRRSWSTLATGQVHTRPFLDLREPGRTWPGFRHRRGDSHLRWTWAARSARSTAPAWRGRRGWPGNTGRSIRSFARSRRSSIREHFQSRARSSTPTRFSPAWPLRTCHCRHGADAFARAARGTTAKTSVPKANSCNGCGAMPHRAPAQRMCPIFRATHERGRHARAPRRTCCAICSRKRPRISWRPMTCAASPTCASIARCAPTSARPMSTFRS